MTEEITRETIAGLAVAYRLLDAVAEDTNDVHAHEARDRALRELFDAIDQSGL